jgi:hypothetical protein
MTRDLAMSEGPSKRGRTRKSRVTRGKKGLASGDARGCQALRPSDLVNGSTLLMTARLTDPKNSLCEESTPLIPGLFSGFITKR